LGDRLRRHKDGTVVSRYVHLDSVRADLRVGMRIKGGELIGRVGRTGVEHSGPHLHFGLSLRPSGKQGTPEKYIDPEPLLRGWALAPLPQQASTTVAAAFVQRPRTR
jgi:murein DD-endopeptidase MepM/ murein hydrolase activator NlpD